MTTGLRLRLQPIGCHCTMIPGHLCLAEFPQVLTFFSPSCCTPPLWPQALLFCSASAVESFSFLQKQLPLSQTNGRLLGQRGQEALPLKPCSLYPFRFWREAIPWTSPRPFLSVDHIWVHVCTFFFLSPHFTPAFNEETLISAPHFRLWSSYKHQPMSYVRTTERLSN